MITTTRNGLFDAFVLVAMGAMFAHRPIAMPLGAAAGGLVLCLCLLTAEVSALVYADWMRCKDMFLMLVPTAFFLFYFVSHIRLGQSPVYRYIRTFSILIYFSHMWLERLIIAVLQRFGIVCGDSLLMYAATLAVTFAFSAAVIALSKTRAFGFLRLLYS